MEINGKNPLAGLNPDIRQLDVAQRQSQRPQRPEDENQVHDSDRIELSVRSREIQHLDALIHSTPDIREGKVEQVRNAIENGTYNVKAEKIADKMLNGSLLDEIF